MPPTHWITMRFGEFLTPNSRPCELAPDQDANLVGMRWYGEGPFHRELKLATKIAKKSHFVIREGDVIYNKLFAWKGSFGVVPAALDGMFVSDKFPTYRLDTSRVSQAFLRWYFRYPQLWDQAREKSTGSAAISKLTLNPPRFLDLTLTAPRLVEEQEAIATRLEAIATKVHEIQSLQRGADISRRALPQVVISEACRAFEADGTLGRVLTRPPRNGWSARCDGAEGGTAVLALGAVTGFHYDPAAIKRTSEPVDSNADYWLKPNDLLITRSNTPQLVGHAAIFSGVPLPCIYPDLMMRLDVDERLVIKKFVWYWLQSTPVRRFVQSKAKGTSPTMKKISQSTVAAIPFPTRLSREDSALLVEKLDQRMRLLRDVTAQALVPSERFSAVVSAAITESFSNVRPGKARAPG